MAKNKLIWFNLPKIKNVLGEAMKYDEINILNFFSKNELNKSAKNCEFVKRKSAKLDGYKFLLMFTTGLLNTTEPSLDQLCTFFNSLTIKHNIKKQSLNERINDNAILFLKECLRKAIDILSKKIELPNSITNFFDHIYITDSTTFNLYPSLKEHYKGTGGSASESAMKIQVTYDYKTGKIYIEIGDIKNSDSKRIEKIVSNDELEKDGKILYLNDLGYFKKKTFETMDLKNEKFISRLKRDVKIYNTNGERIIIKELIKNKPGYINENIKLGKLELRLIGFRLEKEEKEKRIESTKKKRNYKEGAVEKNMEHMEYNFFITNLSEEYTNGEIYILYRLRWQIELIFKTWKSVLKINRIHKCKIERVLCEIYGKLIIATLGNILSYTIIKKNKKI